MSYFTIIVISIIYCCSRCNADYIDQYRTLTSTSTFSSDELQKWTNSSVTTCRTQNVFPMIGGFQQFSAGSSTERAFTNLVPHFSLRVSFTLFLIDCENSTDKEKISVKVDGMEQYQILPSSINRNDYSEFCGNLSFKDYVGNFSFSIANISNSFNLSFSDNFDNSKDQKSWGIRNLEISVLECSPKCKSCYGSWSNQCLSCVANTFLSESGECLCPLGLYWDGNACVSPNENSSFCDTLIFEQIENILILTHSQILEESLEYQGKYLRIEIRYSFLYTTVDFPTYCQENLVTNIIIQNSSTLEFYPLELMYLKDNVQGSITAIEIPFGSDLTDRSQTQSIEGVSNFYVLTLGIQMGNQEKEIRTNRFQVFVSQESSNDHSGAITFSMNLDEQVSDGCKQYSGDCIVIADLDLESKLCKTADCLEVRTNTAYYVGDMIYLQVNFKDQSYTKYISSQTAYFKGDKVVIDFTKMINLVSQIPGKSIFSIKLVYPSESCILQLQLAIQDSKNRVRLRTLQIETRSSEQTLTSTEKEIEQKVQPILLRSFSVTSEVTNSYSEIRSFISMFSWIFVVFVCF